ncbi:MAG: hypothetical protein H7138_18505, partial [Myxococcales bacterium]|nr:hypothetical protein [Myxococcales bacterium]
MRLAVPLLFLLGAITTGCGKSGGDDEPGDFDRVEVSPPTATLTVALGGTATQDYAVFGVRGSTRRDLTAKCVLTLDASFGSFAGAR